MYNLKQNQFLGNGFQRALHYTCLHPGRNIIWKIKEKNVSKESLNEGKNASFLRFLGQNLGLLLLQ